MKNIRQIKQLQSQLNTLQSDVGTLKIELSIKQKEYNQKLDSIKKLKEKIEKLSTTTDLKVSEHAMLRYFERVKGFNMEELEKEILSEKVRCLVDKLGGNGTYPNEGFSIVMKNYTVTTII